MEKQEFRAHIVGTKRNLEQVSLSDRREKRQKMPRNSNNDTKSRATIKKKEIEERKKITSRLRNEALKEIQPIAIGSLAMVASTLSNQGEY